ncbi:MAG: hypothetical protein SFX74_05525 [Fimbriimonadaceae bacterium]|nr:hypothetical protein [Fimbriimonadaceae bacterium]
MLNLLASAALLSVSYDIDPSTPLTKAIADTLYDPLGTGVRYRVGIPHNWTGINPLFQIFESERGAYSTDLSPDSLRPNDYPSYRIIYVDPINGSDQNTGESRSRALRKLSVALGQPGNKWLLCRPTTFDFSTQWNGTVPTGNVIIEPWDESGFITCSTQMNNLNWVKDGGVYTSLASTSTAQLIDEKTRDEYGVGQRLMRASSIQQLRDTPGSYFSESKRVWVNLQDGRVPDSQVLAFTDQSNGRLSSGTTWLRRINFLGSTSPFSLTTSQPGTTLIATDCTFKYGRNNDGIVVDGPATATLIRCRAIGNFGDGIEFRNGARYLVIHAVSASNGVIQSNDNNGLSASGSEGIVIGGRYARNLGRNLFILNNSRLLAYGPWIGDSAATGSDSIDVVVGKGSDDSQAWIIGATYGTGSEYQRNAASTSIIWTRKHRGTRPDLNIKDQVRPF